MGCDIGVWIASLAQVVAVRLRPEEGQDMVEYALLLSAIVLAVFGMILLVGGSLTGAYGHIRDTLASI